MPELSRPCEWLPRPATPAEFYAEGVTDIAKQATVAHLYPNEIDTAEPVSSLVDGTDELYRRALEEFGFERARGIELGLLANALQACDKEGRLWCAACPLAHLDGGDHRLDMLQEEAAAEGIVGGAFTELKAVMQQRARTFYDMCVSTLDV